MKEKIEIKDVDWVVIGAGPAGIAAVGQLLDHGVNPHQLAWIDPTFTVGDFGTKWANVPSNTTVALFLKYLHACRAFHYADCPHHFFLNKMDPKQTCHLNVMTEPLQWVTKQLALHVITLKGFVKELSMQDQRWCIDLPGKKIQAKHVILAIGSEAKNFSYSEIETIPLDAAMDSDRLIHYCNGDDNIAVFGSSHSAILIIRHLLEKCAVKNIINFYRSPLRYAIDLGDQLLFDNTGLKGSTAEWARANLHDALPSKLMRYYSSEENIEHHLPECNKAIYAVGFERRKILIKGIEKMEYNEYNGIIAPGLFGLGIAFPQAQVDRFGNLEYRVGLWKFMDYLITILPIWMRYPI